MVEKEIKTRITHKHGASQEWSEMNPEILLGELIIYDPDESCSYQRIKIGDGWNAAGDLPFLTPYIKPGDNIFINYDYDGAAIIETASPNINEIFEKIYPVGAIYLSVNETSPASIYGGTWEQIKDTFLLAAGDNYAAGTAGGEVTHTLTESEIPLMKGVFELHGISNGSPIYHASGVFTEDHIIEGKYKSGGSVTNDVRSVGRLGFKYGSDEPHHNNMPPYLAVYIWQRIE